MTIPTRPYSTETVPAWADAMVSNKKPRHIPQDRRSKAGTTRKPSGEAKRASGPENATGDDVTETTPVIDLRLLAFIQKRGGRVTERQLVCSLSASRTVAKAKRRLSALVVLGMGCWTYSRPASRGGRPMRLFTLTMSRETIASLLHLTRGSAICASLRQRKISREVVAFLNHFQDTTCRDLADAMGQVRDVLARLADSPGECMIGMGCRKSIRLSARGHVNASWDYP